MGAKFSVAGQPRIHLSTSDFAHAHTILRHKEKKDNSFPFLSLPFSFPHSFLNIPP